jgi:hypothetical protein
MTSDAGVPVALDIGAYCRAVEAHLCRMNGGHLVRIVGPAFELVSGWAREGIPERVVLHGVDRTITRLTAKGPRRRPVRIEFCEADVRDAYDQWRRAVGVHAASSHAATASTTGDATATHVGRGPSLPRHLERTLVKLSSVAATTSVPPSLAAALAATIADVDRCLDDSRGARGEARVALTGQLQAIDGRLAAAAVAALGHGADAEIDEQVRRELAPYRDKLPPPAFLEAARALKGELARKHFGLPQVRFDG